MARVIWKGPLEANLAKMDRDIATAMRLAVETNAPRIESWMKTNAPWTDRTGNARNGLFARPSQSPTSARIVLGHSVPYGIWLEVRWGGRYAIVGPALKEWAPRVMESLSKYIRARFGG